MAKERNYGIDLLRLVLMFMVCMLHVLGHGGILSASEGNALKFSVFWLLETLSYCAVDGFALISGYMATDKPRKYEKIVEMWFQVFFYSFVLTILLTLLEGNRSLGIRDIIKCAMPVMFNKFWYFTAYFALFFAMPVLNRFLFSIDEVTAKKAFLLLVALFSCFSLLTDPFKTEWGYSAFWLMVLYCMGVLAKRIRLFETKSTAQLLLLGAACILISWGPFVFYGYGALISYISPTILLFGMIMVVLFSRMRFCKPIAIASLSPLAFGIYLFHSSEGIWELMQNAFTFLVEKNIIVGVALAFAFAFAICIAGLLVEFIRSKLANFLRIPFLSKKIVALADWAVTKLLIFLR